VTVRHELTADGVPVGTEEQDIVYPSEPDGTDRIPPRVVPRLVWPAFLPARLISVGRPAASPAEITVGAQGAEPSLTATATSQRKAGPSC
jgi:hypothetical protein